MHALDNASDKYIIYKAINNEYIVNEVVITEKQNMLPHIHSSEGENSNMRYQDLAFLQFFFLQNSGTSLF